MTLGRQRPVAGLVHHSDRGAQYTSCAFSQRCHQAGIIPSMGSTGDCYDNALAESLFATPACELISRSCRRMHAEARMAVFEYIEVFDNAQRRHLALGYLSPTGFQEEVPSPSCYVAVTCPPN